ncbi:hypothetical protein QA584_06425 [Anaerocolumna sp. AGMB13025]|uniref:hypothetical protein n=1 Tax=Anaerocolumna sp. AGMB13025 TaxID=3039116 RepID=UPI00241D1438|nr:hypothetical protein [Anaerocolumna sp. AGMB13025]WFR58708.1 hypothetical protein QA584_06425 [Anaerocolumna sp. AGMB13025]
MKNENFSDYEIAELSDSALNQISDLEKTMCGETSKNIVLIAYQNKTVTEKENKIH